MRAGAVSSRGRPRIRISVTVKNLAVITGTGMPLHGSKHWKCALQPLLVLMSQVKKLLKVSVPTVLAAMLGVGGCTAPAAAWKGQVEWPDIATRTNIVPFAEAGAALAAAAAVREMVKENPYPDLFSGCASPEQGLDVAVFTGPTPGLYYVLVDQRFDRCGGPGVRVLDGWYEYAVTPQGEVVGKAPPPPSAEEAAPPATAPSRNPPTTEPTQPPVTEPSTQGDTSSPPPPAPESHPPANVAPTSPPPPDSRLRPTT